MTLKIFKHTFYLRLFSFWKIPLVYFCRPTVLELSDEKCIIKIPFRRRNKNHIGSMYFGALAIGADLTGGLMALFLIKKIKKNISFVFKDANLQFLRRVESDAILTCSDGAAIQQAINRALISNERENVTFMVKVTCPDLSGQDPLALFQFTISLKAKPNYTAN